MHASLLLDDPVSDQLHALTALVEQVRGEVGQLRLENAQLRQQVSELKCDVGYWKSRQLKAERFGKQSEKQSSTDRSNDLEDPSATPKNKKKRVQQPGRSSQTRRDYTHLPIQDGVFSRKKLAK